MIDLSRLWSGQMRKLCGLCSEATGGLGANHARRRPAAHADRGWLPPLMVCRQTSSGHGCFQVRRPPSVAPITPQAQSVGAAWQSGFPGWRHGLMPAIGRKPDPRLCSEIPRRLPRGGKGA